MVRTTVSDNPEMIFQQILFMSCVLHANEWGGIAGSANDAAVQLQVIRGTSYTNYVIP